ncbi:rod shape-determining protein MreC [Kordiimonas sp. SCSIO 12603]|uniref:rod shape-determining protein MreC n=1 Tax=Kordiimonas sp. SCSIO 12603 TaxID=2829596 RepID=UPI00351CCF56
MATRLQSANFSGSGTRRSNRGRDALWLYLVISIVFLGMEVVSSAIPSQVRAYAGDVVSPVLTLLEKPVRAVQSGLERVVGVSDIYLENETLKDENARLKQWREAAMQLSRENEQLRTILKVPKREVTPAATARVIGVGGGAFERSILIGAGSRDNVRYNLPVVDSEGLVGRVLHVGFLSSRVLLVTDLNSRVPVRLERSGELAIAEGQNEVFMRLRFFPEEADIRIGDRFLTSGHGGVFPPDIPVARVSNIDADIITLEPLGLLDKLNYVRVMDYQAVPDDVELLEAEQSNE